MNLCQWWSVWLQQVCCLAHSIAKMTMWEHQITMLEIYWEKTTDSGNPWINFIQHGRISISLRSYHLPALPHSATLPHWTCFQDYEQALVQPKDIQVMGHRSNQMNFPMEDMADMKCCPLRNSQDTGHHLNTPLECLQHRLNRIQLFGIYLPPPLYQDNFKQYLGDPPLASKRNDFSLLRNCAREMYAAITNLPPLPDISADKYEADNESDDLLGLGSATGKALMHLKQFAKRMGQSNFSTFNKWKKVWVAGWLEEKHTLSIRGENHMKQRKMDPCTGRWYLQIFWRLSSPGCVWTTFIILNGCSEIALICFWRTV